MAPRQQAVRRSVVVSSAQWWGQRCSAAGAVAGLAGVQFLNLVGWLAVSGVLIACAEEETKAWALMVAPGGGYGHVGTTGRPNARGLT